MDSEPLMSFFILSSVLELNEIEGLDPNPKVFSPGGLGKFQEGEPVVDNDNDAGRLVRKLNCKRSGFYCTGTPCLTMFSLVC